MSAEHTPTSRLHWAWWWWLAALAFGFLGCALLVYGVAHLILCDNPLRGLYDLGLAVAMAFAVVLAVRQT